jgi:hypothetical protein
MDTARQSRNQKHVLRYAARRMICHPEPIRCEGVEKPESVMLSVAKHLHYLENKRMQILRSAQDDRAG